MNLPLTLNDTLDATLDSDPQALLATQGSLEACEVSTRDFRSDFLLANMPTLRGFKIVGNLALYARLGRGSTGAVYRARHLDLGIDVAVKCLLPEACSDEDDSLSRFRREVALTSMLDHPNVIQVLGSGEQEGVRYLVMEYVHGETVRERVRRRGALPLAEALAIVRRAARGLAAAHRMGLVHRDVKPGNLMVGSSGEVKVCDLGLVKPCWSAARLTRSIAVMGTPQYMSPEQWDCSRDVGPQADVYGLGATLYYLLTGKDAIDGNSILEVQRAALGRPFPSVRKLAPGIPKAVADLIEKCVHRDPAMRYADAGVLEAELDAIYGGSPYLELDAPPTSVGSRPAPADREEQALRRAIQRGRAGLDRRPIRTLASLCALFIAWLGGHVSASGDLYPILEPARTQSSVQAQPAAYQLDGEPIRWSSSSGNQAAALPANER